MSDAVEKALNVGSVINRRPCAGPHSCFPESLCQSCDEIAVTQDELFAPLAEIARAANRRLWWQIVTALGEDADGNDAYQQPAVCVGCKARREEGFSGPYAPSHRDGLMSECPMLETDAKLDALEAKVAERDAAAAKERETDQ